MALIKCVNNSIMARRTLKEYKSVIANKFNLTYRQCTFDWGIVSLRRQKKKKNYRKNFAECDKCKTQARILST